MDSNPVNRVEPDCWSWQRYAHRFLRDVSEADWHYFVCEMLITGTMRGSRFFRLTWVPLIESQGLWLSDVSALFEAQASSLWRTSFCCLMWVTLIEARGLWCEWLGSSHTVYSCEAEGFVFVNSEWLRAITSHYHRHHYHQQSHRSNLLWVVTWRAQERFFKRRDSLQKPAWMCMMKGVWLVSALVN